MSNPHTRRILTILMPIMSVLVSAFIVSHEYSRKGNFERELKATKTEFARLQQRLPKDMRPTAPSEHPDHDSDHHKD